MYDDPTYEAFMLDHAAGALACELHIAAELHLALSGQGQAVAGLWAMVGGALLEGAMAEGWDDARPGRPKARSPHEAGLVRRVLDERDQLRWRPGLFGLRVARLGRHCGMLLRLPAGRSVPAHGHDRLEATVILEGRFDDGRGTFQRGDIAFSYPGLRHKPRAAGESDCVCFVGRATRSHP